MQQNNTRTAYTLDVASHRLVSTTGPTGGTATSTTTRHYSDGSDNPAWVDVDNDANGPNPAVATRFAESLGGDLGVQISEDGSADLTLATLHGDTATTLTLPTAQDESTACTGINAWSDYTEYGTPRAGTSTDAVDGPVGYGWLGAKQRSTTPESAGLTLMGDRNYNPVTGRFTSTDPEPGGNVNTYTYPLDPINMYDLDGHFCVFGKRKNGRCRGAEGAQSLGRRAWRNKKTIFVVGAGIGCGLLSAGLAAGACFVAAASANAAWNVHRYRKYHRKHHRRTTRGGYAWQVIWGAGEMGLSYGSGGYGAYRLRRARRARRAADRHSMEAWRRFRTWRQD